MVPSPRQCPGVWSVPRTAIIVVPQPDRAQSRTSFSIFPRRPSSLPFSSEQRPRSSRWQNMWETNLDAGGAADSAFSLHADAEPSETNALYVLHHALSSPVAFSIEQFLLLCVQVCIYTIPSANDSIQHAVRLRWRLRLQRLQLHSPYGFYPN